jgi:hypothetical protein
MFDPLTLLMVGAGALVFKELNRKDYGVLTPSRDERYRNMMEHCFQPDMLFEEARLFAEYGLNAQSLMLKRRAEWRSRPEDLKKAHEDIFQKALLSSNIPGILEVASAFEGWTATKKAEKLREHVRVLHETSIQEAAQRAAESINTDSKKSNGKGQSPEPFTGVINTQSETVDDT